MTEAQKTEIARQRRAGTSFSQIAQNLNLSINTVKSYCQRNNVTKNSDVKKDVCVQCGTPLIQKEKTKRRRFCCSQCRVKWWNSHPEAVNKKALYKNKCAYCGKNFTAYGNSHRKYCSHQCYIKARYGGQNDE